MKDLGGLLKQAQNLQKNMAEAQAKAQAVTAEGSAGGGLVTMVLNGKGEIDGLTIDPSLLTPDEAPVLEDLIRAAHSDAKRKVDVEVAEAMKGATAGLGDLPFPIPGLK